MKHYPNQHARTWPRRFIEAIPVGVTVDDHQVVERFLHWVLVSEPWGVRHATDDQQRQAIIDRVGALFAQPIAGDPPSDDEFEGAAREAIRAARASDWAGSAACIAAKDAARAALSPHGLTLSLCPARVTWAACVAWSDRVTWLRQQAEVPVTDEDFTVAASEELLRLLRETA